MESISQLKQLEITPAYRCPIIKLVVILLLPVPS